jgi:hypothetical protein
MVIKVKYVIVRKYSGVTKQKQLWQVLSRPFDCYNDAGTWLDFFMQQETKKRPSRRKQVFIATIPEFAI